MRNERFGALLSEGLSSVAKRHHKTLSAVDAEIVRELRLKAWTVQGWRRGYVPRQAEQIAFLARYCVANGRLPVQWAHSFLLQGRYPDQEAQALLGEMFPQAQHPGGQRQAPHADHNLPPLHGEFIGRQMELARVLEGLASPWPVVTIEGLGGSGKTTLAIAAARRALAGPDAALERPFQAVAWTSARDRLEKKLWLGEVLNTVARVLDYPYIPQLPDDARQAAVDQLLRTHRTLVVVDNFETIDDPALLAWMHQVPEPSKVLITSRDGQLRSGWNVHLGGLDEPEALELIRRHAQRLGLPKLASAPDQDLLELARATHGSPRALGMAMGYLKGGHRQLSEVVADLRAASRSVGDIFASLFNWHWSALSANAQRVLLAMSFFADTACKAALGATAGLGDDDLDAALDQLVLTSLFEPHESALSPARAAISSESGAPHDGSSRYRIHPLTRAFAATQAAEDAARDWVTEARPRWVGWYHGFAERNSGSDRTQWAIPIDLMRDEWTNLMTAVAWCAANGRYDDVKGFWHNDRVEQVAYMLGYWPDALTWCDWLIAAAEQRADWIIVGSALSSKSWALVQMGRAEHLREAVRHLARLAHLRRREPAISAFSLVTPCSSLRLRQKRYASGLWWLARAEELLEQDGLDERERASLMIHIPRYRALAYLELGDYPRAREYCQQALRNTQVLGWSQPVAHLINTLADIALREGDLDAAERLLRDGLPAALRLDDRRRVALYNRSFAFLEQARHHDAEMRRRASEALDGFERLGIEPEAQEMRRLLAATPAPVRGT
ncbi:MAG TPA: NB-ARC domain-containing protein [Ktedonobacterales bacterium]|nr:NB-ARC domain-containing protein [Ktedonobacterales bacterium]